MTYIDALTAAHLVKHVPGAARALMDAWLKAAEDVDRPPEGAAEETLQRVELALVQRAGYTLTPEQEVQYLRSQEVGIQHRDDIAHVWGYGWELPPCSTSVTPPRRPPARPRSP